MGQILATFQAQPDTTQTVTLGDEQVRIRVYYRARLGAWYVDFLTLDDTAIATGRRVSPGWDLLTGLLGGVPAGHLFVQGSDPYTREMLGERVNLVYYTADEIPDPEASTLLVVV